MRILLAGGGSGGPVMPVLAVALEIKKIRPDAEFLFVGTKTGPERKMVEEVGVKFKAIPASKWRRYFSLKNLFAPFVLAIAFFKARKIVNEFKPQAMFSAGGYVAVPIAFAARLHGCRIVIHQQDAQIGLANKLIAPIADQITTAFEVTAKEFYSGSGLFNKKWKPAVWVGNPVRPDLFKANYSANKHFGLHDQLPILLVLGGAIGSAQINDLIFEILPDLVINHQVVHQTGKGKNILNFMHKDYHPEELMSFNVYASILKQAHMVIARSGLSTIAELSVLGKTSIIIPMPDTHQEKNAKILKDTHSAVVLSGPEATSEILKRVINALKFDQKRTAVLSSNILNLMPKDAAKKLAVIILKQ